MEFFRPTSPCRIVNRSAYIFLQTMFDPSDPFCTPVAKLQAELLSEEHGIKLRQNTIDLNGYLCLQCDDYLQDPVSCITCSAHFCRSCVTRLPSWTGFRECPACQSLFKEAKADYRLAWRMCTARLPCRYADCRVFLPLAQIIKHERTCNTAMVHCRFKPFGCPWVGARGDVGMHEVSKCTLSKVERALEQFRLVVQSERQKSSSISETGRLIIVQEFLSFRDCFRIQQAKQALSPRAASRAVMSRSLHDSLSAQLMKLFKDESTSWQAQRSLLMQALYSLQEQWGSTARQMSPLVTETPLPVWT